MPLNHSWKMSCFTRLSSAGHLASGYWLFGPSNILEVALQNWWITITCKCFLCLNKHVINATWKMLCPWLQVYRTASFSPSAYPSNESLVYFYFFVILVSFSVVLFSANCFSKFIEAAVLSRSLIVLKPLFGVMLTNNLLDSDDR